MGLDAQQHVAYEPSINGAASVSVSASTPTPTLHSAHAHCPPRYFIFACMQSVSIYINHAQNIPLPLVLVGGGLIAMKCGTCIYIRWTSGAELPVGIRHRHTGTCRCQHSPPLKVANNTPSTCGMQRSASGRRNPRKPATHKTSHYISLQHLNPWLSTPFSRSHRMGQVRFPCATLLTTSP